MHIVAQAASERLRRSTLPRGLEIWSRAGAVALGAPLLLTAIAFGIGSDVALWCAPWSLLGATPWLAGRRIATPVVLALLPVALLAGPAPFAGLVGGALAGGLGNAGWRPLAALPAVPVGAAIALAVLSTAWA